jgi:hypothetical protein
MLPHVGPIAISIPGVSGVAIPAATDGAQVRYRWPATYKLCGIDLCVRSGLDTHLANTRLLLIDDKNIVLCTNGLGTVSSMSGLANRGIAPLNHTFGGRVNAFQRIVRAGDIWMIQVFNDNVGIAIVPELFFRLEAAVTVVDEGRAA